jgi:hypothetical protein
MAATQLEPERHLGCGIYIKDLDSVDQADVRDRTEWLHKYTGIVRLAALLWPWIVLPDTMLLDGKFFLELGPDGLFDIIGTTPELEAPALPLFVRSRHKDLGDALVALVKHPEELHLRGFEFSVLPARMRDDLKRLLPHHLREELESEIALRGENVAGLCAFLKRVLLGHGWVADQVDATFQPLEQQWNAWIDAARCGMIHVAEWPKRKANFRRAFNRWENPNAKRSTLSPQGRHAFDEIMAVYPLRGRPPQVRRRSEVYEDLKHLLSSPQSAPDYTAIKSWYDACYHRAIAFQHGALFIEVSGKPRSTWVAKTVTAATYPFRAITEGAMNLGRRKAGRTEPVRLPPDVLRDLSIMPASVYRRIAYRTRDARERIAPLWIAEDGRLSKELPLRLRRWLEMQSINTVMLHEIEQPQASTQLLDSIVRVIIVLVFSLFATLLTGRDGWLKSVWALPAYGLLLLFANCLDQVRLWFKAFGESVEGTIALPRKISR